MQGLSPEQARGNFWVLDKQGLITAARQGLEDNVQPFARAGADDQDGESLLSVVQRVKPTVLVRACSRAFRAPRARA